MNFGHETKVVFLLNILWISVSNMLCTNGVDQEMHRDAVCCAEYCAAWSIHYHLQWLSLCTVWFSEVFNLYHATNLFLDFIYSWLFLFQSELSKCETQAKLSKAHYHQKEYIWASIPRHLPPPHPMVMGLYSSAPVHTPPCGVGGGGGGGGGRSCKCMI